MAEQPTFQLPVNLRVRHAEPTSEVFVTSDQPYLNMAVYLPADSVKGLQSGRHTLSFTPTPAPPPPAENATEQGSSGAEAGGGAGGSGTETTDQATTG